MNSSDAAALANGIDTDKDLVVEDQIADSNGAAEVESVVKVYFVRLPRPQLDDAHLKKLQAEFQSHVADIKGINARLAAKREIVRELRKQMSEARSLKDTSKPEFEEKLNRLKQLRDLRSGYMDKISVIKNNIKGLEYRTEAELDARVVELEEKIRFGTIPIREEKMVVNEISKLRGQREKIKEFELHKSSLVELEAECKKVKAVIEEMDGEFSIIKGERDAASGIIKDFWTQLKAAEAEAAKVEYEQKEAVDKKNEALEALEAARREVDGTMVDYRNNKKFSLQISDLILAGQVEEAQQVAAKQSEEWISKFSSDTVFRSEYNKMWADQRKYAVSDLLPESSTSAAAAAATKQPSKGAKGAKGASAAPAEKPVARGAEKAKDLIASLMLQASTEAARAKTSAPQHYSEEEEEDEDDVPAAAAADAPKAAPAKPVAPPKPVTNPAAKAAEVFNFKVELPVIEDVAFVPPVVAVETQALSKDQIREEQKLKAQEAEERKKRKQESSDKKRVKAIELGKKSEEEERAAKAKAQAAAAAAAKAAAAAAAEAEAQAKAEAEEAAAAASEDSSARAYGKPSPSLNASALKPAATAIKRPAGKGSLLKKLKKFYQQYETAIVVAAVILLIIFILLIASLY